VKTIRIARINICKWSILFCKEPIAVEEDEWVVVDVGVAVGSIFEFCRDLGDPAAKLGVVITEAEGKESL
jgi:hypothetical protein